MTTIKNRSRIVEEMQEIFSDLKRAGVINKKQIAQFEALKNLEVKTIQPKAIKQLRTKENLSQAVFAIVLNTSASTIQKWESGEKKPSGPSLKLLSILKNKGIINEADGKKYGEVEVIAKTIDMVNPYEYANGLDYELGQSMLPVRCDLT